MNYNQNRDASIGVFDSGVGGLTVVSEIMKQLPNENVIYFGDTARVPYGSKSRDTITHYSEQIIRFLLTKNVKAIVIACNTASSYALDTVAEEFDLPIIGVIEPGAKSAVQMTKNHEIGIIGTEGTISSEIYTKTIADMDASAHVTGRACPLFVPLVEEGWIDDPVTLEVATRYLKDLKDSSIDTLIMGCTHYPHLAPVLQRVLGDSVSLVNPAYETARELKALLSENNLLRLKTDKEHDWHWFYVSDTANKFRAFANTILPFEIDKAIKINIEQY